MNVTFDIDITISGGGSTCTLTGQTVSFKEQLVLCFPDTFDESNLRCRILTLVCDLVDFTPPVGTTPGSITLELSICKEVQVQAEVKLEVEAKFCQPRPPIQAPPLSLCPPINFPQQCDIFPIANCECQASAFSSCTVPTGTTCTLALTLNGTLVTPAPTGTQTLSASICSNCSPQNTTVNFVFNESPVVGTDNSFNFVNNPNVVPTVTCANVLGVLSIVTVEGQGTVTLNNGTTIPVTYNLVLNSNTNTYVLTLTGTGFLAVAAGVLAGAPNFVTITDCVTLG
ncbi:MAG: hypothetical protein WBZ33_06325 [Thermoactinomyces sp.]